MSVKPFPIPIWIILLATVVLLSVSCENDPMATVATVDTSVSAEATASHPTSVPIPSSTTQTVMPPLTAPPPMDTPFPTPVATSSLVEGWLVYHSDFYQYEISYPSEAELKMEGVSGYPTEEKPDDVSSAQYLNQLRRTYPNDICLSIGYQGGFVTVFAPWEEGGKYGDVCPALGIGDYDLVEKRKTIEIDGTTYTAEGYEVHDQDAAVSWRGEFFSFQLEDGATITVGGGLDGEITQEAFLPVKKVLKQIVGSYRSLDS
jgi:hypothetical protein